MEKDTKKENTKLSLSFAAIGQYVESNIVLPTEIDSKKGFVSWGKNNDYPNYILSLYDDVATLKSIIDGLTDYVAGDEIKVKYEQYKEQINSKGETVEEIFQRCAKDYCIYGGFALNVIKNRMGTVAEIYYLDFSHIRSNEDRTKFYYSKDWGKSWGRVKFLEYPAYSDEKENINSIFFYSNEYNKVYPTPIYGASLKSCEIEKAINEYHLNSINNNFAGSYIVNFNGGKPTDEQKEEIEDNFYEKYVGYENASRPVLSFNDSKEHEVTITKIDSEDFGEKYDSLSKRSKQELFTAFRAIPALFGIMTETTGFSEQEFKEAYKLFSRTMVKPIQNKLIAAFDKILGKDCIEIIPFKIDWED